MRNQVYRKFLVLVGLGVYSYLVADYVKKKTVSDILNSIEPAQSIKPAVHVSESKDNMLFLSTVNELPAPHISIMSNVDEEKPFDIDNVIELGKRYNIRHLDIVVAQMIEESANLKSSLYKTQNNMFGMKVATNRPTTAIGKNKNGYADYESPLMSLIDYALYQAAYNRTPNRKVYLQKLASGYAHIDGYVNRLEAIIKSYDLKSRCL